jgi:hypothetical protein
MAAFRRVWPGVERASGTTIVYDAEALFSARDVMRHAVLGTPLPPADAARLLDEELALADGTDAVICVNEQTARPFRAAGHRDVRVLGYAIARQPMAVRLDGRHGFLFVGPTYSEHSSNGDGII